MILTCPECETRYFAKDGAFDAGPRKVKCASCGHVWTQTPEAAEASLAAAAGESAAGGDVALKARPNPEESSKPKSVAEEFDSLPPLPPSEDDGGGGKAESAGPFEAAMAKARSARPRGAVVGETLPIEEFGGYGGWFSPERIASVVLALMIFTGVIGAAVQYRVELTRLWPSLAGVYALLGVPVNATGMEIRNSTWQIETRDGMPMLTVRGEIVNTTDIDRAVPRLRFSVRDAEGRELYHWNIVPDVKRLGPAERSRFTTFLPSPPPEAHDIQIQFAVGGG